MTEDPFSAPASAPSINKIPFLVFDAILVITAVALALTSGGPLSPVLFFWILLCVVVGGLVGCLPFWIEFRDRMRLSEYEIRERQSSAHDSQWQYVDARLVEQNEFLQKLHLRLSDSADRLASLEARPPTPTADEIALLCGSALQKQWPAWREELLTVLSRRTDILFNEQNAQSAKLSAAHENRLSELRKEFLAVEAVLRGLETRVGEIALLSAASAATVVVGNATPLAGSMAQSGAQALVADEVPEPDSEEALAVDDFLAEEITNASDIAEAEDVAETEDFIDVTDIEDSASFDGFDSVDEVAEEDFDAAADTATTVFANDESDYDSDVEAIEETVTETPAIEIGAAAASSVPAETVISAEIITPAEPVAPVESIAPAEAVAPVEPVVAAEASAIAPEQPALLETPAVAPPPARASKSASAEKTTLVAQVLIGIGNKPYVRGIGPGLSLEKGVPMQFVEIGKWEWVCPSGAVPVKIQIYKNDETPSTLGQIDLEAGQRKAVTPFFPK